MNTMTCERCDCMKDEGEFPRSRSGFGATSLPRMEVCRSCRRSQQTMASRDKRRATPEGRAEVTAYQRGYNLRQRFGITSGEFDAMLEAQGGVCACCSKPETAAASTGGIRNLAVDHCHESGRVRGLLCNTCNVMIGMAYDDPSVLLRGAEYLSNYEEFTP